MGNGQPTNINTILFASGNKITPALSTTAVDSTTAYVVKFNHGTYTGVAGTYGTSANATATSLIDNGFTVPQFGVDSYGHVTTASTVKYTLPTAVDYKLINNTARGGTGTYDTTIRLYADNDSDNGGTI